MASLCAIVLVACGADVNTELRIQSDYSGVRTFVMTMAETDAESLVGGIDAAAQVLEESAPDVLIFEGVSEEDAGYSATFTMPFDDLEDYENKLTRLLDASEVSAADRAMSVEFTEGALVDSVSIEENFYNDDLMGWAAAALTSEDIVASNATVLTSNGRATVTFNDAEIENSTSLPRINVSHTNDHRFEDVGANLEFLDSGELRFSFEYLISGDSAEPQNDFLSQQVEQLNNLPGLPEPATDSGTPSGGATTREISVLFSTVEAASAGLPLLLANEDATLESREITNTASPDVVTQFIGENWSCEEICNPNNLQQLAGDTLYPDQWQLVEQRREDGTFFVEFNRGMPLESLNVLTRLELSGAVEQVFEFTMDNSAQQGHEEAITERLAPPAGLGTFTVTEENAKTIYTTAFSASTAEQTTGMINEYLSSRDISPDAAISHDPISGVWASYDLQVDVSPIWELISGGVEDTATFEVALPAMHSGTIDDSDASRRLIINDSNGSFIVAASGPTATTFWMIGLITLLVLVSITFLIRTRKASTRVWAVASTTPETAAAYNVQRSSDYLTETEIFQTPPGLGSTTQEAETTKLSAEPRRAETQPADDPVVFPDVPLPVDDQYQKYDPNTVERGDHSSRQEDKPPNSSETDTEK